jgi:hypothetical protein
MVIFFVACSANIIVVVYEALVEEVARIRGEKDRLAQDHAQNLERSKKMAEELKTRNHEMAGKCN